MKQTTALTFKHFAILIFLFSAFVLLSGCTAERTAGTGWNYNDPQNGGFEETSAEESPMITYTGSVRMKTDEKDSDISSEIEMITLNMGGYMINSGTDNCKMGVPSDSITLFVNQLTIYGDILEKEIKGVEITNAYQNLQIRLETAYKTRERYLQLLEKAYDVTSSLKIERELERINGTIDEIEFSLDRMDKRLKYAQIEVSWKKQNKPGPIGYLAIGIYTGVKWLFVRN